VPAFISLEESKDGDEAAGLLMRCVEAREDCGTVSVGLPLLAEGAEDRGGMSEFDAMSERRGNGRAHKCV
jgi:hypothetical protein